MWQETAEAFAELLSSDFLDAVELPAITVEQVFAQVRGAHHEQFEAGQERNCASRLRTCKARGSWSTFDSALTGVSEAVNELNLLLEGLFLTGDRAVSFVPVFFVKPMFYCESSSATADSSERGDCFLFAKAL